MGILFIFQHFVTALSQWDIIWLRKYFEMYSTPLGVVMSSLSYFIYCNTNTIKNRMAHVVLFPSLILSIKDKLEV